VFAKRGIHVEFPIQHIDHIVKIVLAFRGHILDEQASVDGRQVHQGLKHGKDVTVGLWLVGEQAARRMEHSGRDIPTRPRLKGVGFGKIQNLVVPAVPGAQALPHLISRCSGLQTEKGVGESSRVVVQLGGEVVRLRLGLLAHPIGVHSHLMHVQRERSEIVKEFGIHGPAAVGIHEPLPNNARSLQCHHLSKRHSVEIVTLCKHHIAQAFV